MQSIPKFQVGDSAWLTLPRRGSFEVEIKERQQDPLGTWSYQVQSPEGLLYNNGEWVPQKSLSKA